jgi:hypothetical protein
MKKLIQLSILIFALAVSMQAQVTVSVADFGAVLLNRKSAVYQSEF